MRRFFLSLVFISFCSLPFSVYSAEVSDAPGIQWEDWSDGLFDRAQKETRYVLLNMEAVWCHWCHVMEEKTYHHPEVVKLIQEKFIPVKVDQDANPDLSLRYENFGWPATVIFNPKGGEKIKLRGYIPAPRLLQIMRVILEKPDADLSELEEPIAPSENAFLTQDQIETIKREHFNFYDDENGGWGLMLKLIDPNHLEYAMIQAQKRNSMEEEMARRTLDQALKLLDPIAGGFYQYSDEPDWSSPHYEKIMWIQTDYMRLYSLAYAIWDERKYLEAAKATARYLKTILRSEEGAFYTSQDADVSQEITGKQYYNLDAEGRRKLGIPRIDKNIYARENGWVISSLAHLYAVTGDDVYIEDAKKAAEWVMQNRALPGGGFKHGEKDRRGPFFGDTLAMGQAFLDLHVATGERHWLANAQMALEFIAENFQDMESGGFISAPVSEKAAGVFKNPLKKKEENVKLVRLAMRIYHYTAHESYKQMAEHAMRYLASPALIKNEKFVAGLILADAELASDPDHITIVGYKDEAMSKKLYLAGLRYPATYKRIEWWDKREGPLPNADIQYPQLDQPAAFACAARLCSLPVLDPNKLAASVDRLKRKRI